MEGTFTRTYGVKVPFMRRLKVALAWPPRSSPWCALHSSWASN